MKNGMILFAASCALATAVACGSSSSNPNTNTDAGGSSGSAGSGSASSGSADDSGGGSGSSSGTGQQEAAAPSCMTKMDCTGGQICCLTGFDMATFTPTTACSMGTCPMFFGMTIQLCGSDSECAVAGQTCMAGPMGMGMICGTPRMMMMMRDSGSPPVDSGSGDAGGDAAPQDAATGG
jgi:hypothetical protein